LAPAEGGYAFDGGEVGEGGLEGGPAGFEVAFGAEGVGVGVFFGVAKEGPRNWLDLGVERG